MGKGLYTPKPMIPVEEVSTVPSRAVDCRSNCRTVRHRLDGKHPQFGGARVLCLMVEECVELQLDGREGCVDLRLPLAEGFVKFHIALLLRYRGLREAVVVGDLMVGEALLDCHSRFLNKTECS
jgi:hypothetical protein